MKRSLLTLIALAFASPAFACNYGYASVGACYAPPVVAQIAYAAPVQLQVQYVAPVVQTVTYAAPVVAQVAAVDYCPQATYGFSSFGYGGFGAAVGYGGVGFHNLTYGGAGVARVRAGVGYGGAAAFAGGRVGAVMGGGASVAIQGRRGEAIAATGNRVDVRQGIFGTRVRAR